MQCSSLHSGDEQIRDHRKDIIFALVKVNKYDSDSELYLVTASFALLVQTSVIAFFPSFLRQFDVKRYQINIPTALKKLMLLILALCQSNI